MESLGNFLTVISPPERIKKDVRFFKDNFQQRYGYFKSFSSTAHVSIGVSHVPTEKVENFFNDVRDSISEIEPYDLQLQDFYYFRNGRVIYIDVAERNIFQKIVKKIKLTSALHGISEHCSYSDYPYMTIARNLSVPVFNRAQVDYFSKNYEESFTVSKLNVLKWNSSEGKYYPFTELSLW